MAVDPSMIAGLGKEAEAQSIGRLMNMGKMAYGAIQAIRANKDLKTLKRPIRTTDENILYNQALARENASEGYSSASKNLYTDNVNRALGSGINAILSGGGDVNMISSLVNGVLPSYRQMMIEDSRLKDQKQGLLMNANQAVAAENEANFDYNQNIPYLQRYYRDVQQTNAGVANVFGGMEGAAGQANAASVNGIDYNALISGMQQNKTSNPYMNNQPQYGAPVNSYTPQPYGSYKQNNFDYQPPTMYG